MGELPEDAKKNFIKAREEFQRAHDEYQDAPDYELMQGDRALCRAMMRLNGALQDSLIAVLKELNEIKANR